jgi:hypothetical protein
MDGIWTHDSPFELNNIISYQIHLEEKTLDIYFVHNSGGLNSVYMKVPTRRPHLRLGGLAFSPNKLNRL